MKASQRAYDLIKKYETLRLRAYRCPAGVLTIGYGHTEGVGVGLTIDKPMAEQLLREDLGDVEREITPHITAPVNQNEFDALVLFAFNVGCNAFAGSTLLKLLNDGDRVGASQQFQRWKFAKGKVLNGLVTRRAAEAALFLKPEAGGK
jgi:lysozyme